MDNKRRLLIADVKAANVRAGPGTSHPIVAKLARGERLQVLERKDGWEKVRIANPSREGWIFGKLTNPDPVRTSVSSTPAARNRAPSKPSWCRTVNPSDFDVVVYRREPARKRVYVNRVWYGMMFDQKQALAMYFADCQDILHVVDAYSGKELATTRFTGTTIHQ